MRHGWFSIVLMCIVFSPFWMIIYFAGTDENQTQPAIQTVIVSVRGCDIVQMVQDDKLVTAFSAPDQPKSCKVAK